MTGKYKIVTICGSMRYFQQMLTAAEVFTERGYIVLMPYVTTFTEGGMRKKVLDEMHRAKIDLSETIVVVGEHKGESTRSEMEYATSQGKGVVILNSSLDDTMDPPCMGNCELKIRE